MVTYSQIRRKGRVRKYHWNTSFKLRKCPHKQGVVYRLAIVSPKKPNSAKRKIAKVRLSTGKKALVHISAGSDHNLQNFMRVLVQGGKRKDTVGCHYKVVRSSKAGWKWHVGPPNYREQRRSKFGVCRKENRVNLS